MRNISKPVLVGGGAVLAAFIAFLAFGVFGVHTLFIDDEVAEANPFAVVESDATPIADTSVDEASTETDTPGGPETDSAEPVVGEPETAEPSAPVEDVAPEVITVTTGSFIDGDHPTSGTGLTITDGSQTFLRFEGFETDNGPDLNVYLRNSDDPSDYIDLGDLKGNIGDQNYELPAGIDLDRYDFIDIWCVRFGVSFGTAQLSS